MTTKSEPYLPRHQNLGDRLVRAKSWLDAASSLEERDANQVQIQVVFIYRTIAFNALYGRRQYESQTKTIDDLKEFFNNILALHKDDRRAGGNTLAASLERGRAYWEKVIEDEFVSNWYYNHPLLKPGFKRWYWKRRSEACSKWTSGEYRDLLLEIFMCIMVLRSQIFHGCVTFGRTSLGWASVEKATPVMRELVPAFYQLMFQYGDRMKWPKIPYPRRGSVQHPHRPRGE